MLVFSMLVLEPFYRVSGSRENNCVKCGGFSMLLGTAGAMEPLNRVSGSREK